MRRLIVISALATGLGACGGSSLPASPPTTLVIAQGGDPGALNPAVTTSGNTHPVTRFLTHGRDDVLRTLTELLERGDATHDAATGEYRLTEIGRKEAARRFAEEFAPMLSQGHGECNDPNCDCHSNPLGAAECHAARGPHR